MGCVSQASGSPRQAPLALGSLCCLGPESPGLFTHSVFSVPDVSDTALGARDVKISETGSWEQGALSHMGDHSTTQGTPQIPVQKCVVYRRRMTDVGRLY